MSKLNLKTISLSGVVLAALLDALLGTAALGTILAGNEFASLPVYLCLTLVITISAALALL